MIARNSNYPTLSTVANLLSVGGWAVVVVGVIVVVYGLVSVWSDKSAILGLLGGLVAAALGLATTAAGEVVGVWFDIERNTRTASTAGHVPEKTP